MLTNEEFEELINDQSKRIDVDISWEQRKNHPTYVGFQAEIISDTGYPLFVKGSYDARIDALSFVLIYRSSVRIYGLDLGKDHTNPDGERVGEKHKHRWSATLRDKEAYVPSDITASAAEPVNVWEQFCREAKIVHNGTMKEPPPLQLDLFA
jgi:hypothetical protein